MGVKGLSSFLAPENDIHSGHEARESSLNVKRNVSVSEEMKANDKLEESILAYLCNSETSPLKNMDESFPFTSASVGVQWPRLAKVDSSFSPLIFLIDCESLIHYLYSTLQIFTCQCDLSDLPFEESYFDTRFGFNAKMWVRICRNFLCQMAGRPCLSKHIKQHVKLMLVFDGIRIKQSDVERYPEIVYESETDEILSSSSSSDGSLLIAARKNTVAKRSKERKQRRKELDLTFSIISPSHVAQQQMDEKEMSELKTGRKVLYSENVEDPLIEIASETVDFEPDKVIEADIVQVDSGAESDNEATSDDELVPVQQPSPSSIEPFEIYSDKILQISELIQNLRNPYDIQSVPQLYQLQFQSNNVSFLCQSLLIHTAHQLATLWQAKESFPEISVHYASHESDPLLLHHCKTFSPSAVIVSSDSDFFCSLSVPFIPLSTLCFDQEQNFARLYVAPRTARWLGLSSQHQLPLLAALLGNDISPGIKSPDIYHILTQLKHQFPIHLDEDLDPKLFQLAQQSYIAPNEHDKDLVSGRAGIVPRALATVRGLSDAYYQGQIAPFLVSVLTMGNASLSNQPAFSNLSFIRHNIYACMFCLWQGPKTVMEREEQEPVKVKESIKWAVEKSWLCDYNEMKQASKEQRIAVICQIMYGVDLEIPIWIVSLRLLALGQYFDSNDKKLALACTIAGTIYSERQRESRALSYFDALLTRPSQWVMELVEAQQLAWQHIDWCNDLFARPLQMIPLAIHGKWSHVFWFCVLCLMQESVDGVLGWLLGPDQSTLCHHIWQWIFYEAPEQGESWFATVEDFTPFIVDRLDSWPMNQDLSLDSLTSVPISVPISEQVNTLKHQLFASFQIESVPVFSFNRPLIELSHLHHWKPFAYHHTTYRPKLEQPRLDLSSRKLMECITLPTHPLRSSPPPPALSHGLQYESFQLEAFSRLRKNQSLLVHAPTGSGKTEVAMYAMYRCMCLYPHDRILFICPTKALVHQHVATLQERFKRQDASIAAAWTSDHAMDWQDAAVSIIVTVPELALLLIAKPSHRILRQIKLLVMDEIHLIMDRDRGHIVEQLLLYLPESVQFCLLSATVGQVSLWKLWFQQWRGKSVDVVLSKKQPVEKQWFVYGLGLESVPSSWMTKSLTKSPLLQIAEALVDGSTIQFAVHDLNQLIASTATYDESIAIPDIALLALRVLLEPETPWITFKQWDQLRQTYPTVFHIPPTPADLSNYSVKIQKLVEKWQLGLLGSVTPKMLSHIVGLVHAVAGSNINAVPLLDAIMPLMRKGNNNDLMKLYCIALLKQMKEPTANDLEKLRSIDPVLLLTLSDQLSATFSHEDDVAVSFSAQELVNKYFDLFLLPAQNAFQKQTVTFLYTLYYDLKSTEKCPAILFVSSRRSCGEFAKLLADRLPVVNTIRELHGLSKDLKYCLERGIGFHHGGLSSHERLQVEQYMQQGHSLSFLFSTSTLSFGIHCPCRSVVYLDCALHHWKTLDLLQMLGRAGRRGFDTQGNVIVSGAWSLEIMRNRLARSIAPLTGHFDSVLPTGVLQALRLYSDDTQRSQRVYEFSLLNCLLPQGHLYMQRCLTFSLSFLQGLGMLDAHFHLTPLCQWSLDWASSLGEKEVNIWLLMSLLRDEQVLEWLTSSEEDGKMRLLQLLAYFVAPYRCDEKKERDKDQVEKMNERIKKLEKKERAKQRKEKLTNPMKPMPDCMISFIANWHESLVIHLCHCAKLSPTIPFSHFQRFIHTHFGISYTRFPFYLEKEASLSDYLISFYESEGDFNVLESVGTGHGWEGAGLLVKVLVQLRRWCHGVRMPMALQICVRQLESQWKSWFDEDKC